MISHWQQRWEGHPDEACRDVAVFLCAFAVLFSVTWSFLNFHEARPVARRKRSVVDTFSMVLFFVLFSWLVVRRVGVLGGMPPSIKMAALCVGVAVVVIGCVVNVVGRHQLGGTWANQIAIYRDHQLLSRGLFGLVRHPLYASTIWMFLGASLAFWNPAALLSTLGLFIPAMWYRARQEEELLLERFPEYAIYRERTGAFFPKFSLVKGKNP